MSNITTLQTIALSTALSGGVQPYDPCATWVGVYTDLNDGTTGSIPINGGPYSTGTPWIDSPGACAGPVGKGSLTGTFRPNGFTGEVDLWVYGKDASGIADGSNILTYGVVESTALLVNAGLDQTVVGPAPVTANLSTSSATGGTSPYSWLWVQSGTGPSPSPSIDNNVAQHPNITNLYTNGVYTFQCTVTDSTSPVPLTGTDSVAITVTGADDPINPVSSAAMTWVYFREPSAIGFFQIERKRGTGFWTTLVNLVTQGSQSGDILSGYLPNEVETGDQIRVTVTCTDGSFDGSYTSRAYLQMQTVQRTFPYTPTVEFTDTIIDTGGSTVTVQHIFIVDLGLYQYQISGAATLE